LATGVAQVQPVAVRCRKELPLHTGGTSAASDASCAWMLARLSGGLGGGGGGLGGGGRGGGGLGRGGRGLGGGGAEFAGRAAMATMSAVDALVAPGKLLSDPQVEPSVVTSTWPPLPTA
jgi:hypothetical protein